MKRQVIAAVMGMAMMLGTASVAMADDGSDHAMTVTPSSKVEMAIEAEDTNALPFYKLEDLKEGKDGEKIQQLVYGTLNREQFQSVLDALKLSDAEKDTLLGQFDRNLELKQQAAKLMENFWDLSEQERLEAEEQASKLREKETDLFTDEIVDQAIKMGLISKSDVQFSITAVEGSNGVFNIKDEPGADGESSVGFTATVMTDATLATGADAMEADIAK